MRGEISSMLEASSKKVCVLGLGYVGYPLAVAFSKHYDVMGFDINPLKLNHIRKLITGREIKFTSDPPDLFDQDFFIVCVPTPVSFSKEPDLNAVLGAAELIGKYGLLKRANSLKQIAILESTVAPGTTENTFSKRIEEVSHLKVGIDFGIGYSPETINPGDPEHSIENVVKVVAGSDHETTERMSELYSKITQVYTASSISVAEAAKITENIQRDLNIALINELAIIFRKMGISIKDVLQSASTKWNFQKYDPGMVGGHCIPVDPYYLLREAYNVGYHPKVILAGRSLNDEMPNYMPLVWKTKGEAVEMCKIALQDYDYYKDLLEKCIAERYSRSLNWSEIIRSAWEKHILGDMREYSLK